MLSHRIWWHSHLFCSEVWTVGLAGTKVGVVSFRYHQPISVQSTIFQYLHWCLSYLVYWGHLRPPAIRQCRVISTQFQRRWNLPILIECSDILNTSHWWLAFILALSNASFCVLKSILSSKWYWLTLFAKSQGCENWSLSQSASDNTPTALDILLDDHGDSADESDPVLNEAESYRNDHWIENIHF